MFFRTVSVGLTALSLLLGARSQAPNTLYPGNESQVGVFPPCMPWLHPSFAPSMFLFYENPKKL